MKAGKFCICAEYVANKRILYAAVFEVERNWMAAGTDRYRRMHADGMW